MRRVSLLAMLLVGLVGVVPAQAGSNHLAVGCAAAAPG